MQLGDRARHDFNILLKHDLLHRPLNVVVERSMPKRRCWRYLRGICRKMTWAVKKPWMFGSLSVLHYQWESLLTNQVMEWNVVFWDATDSLSSVIPFPCSTQEGEARKPTFVDIFCWLSMPRRYQNSSSYFVSNMV